MRNRFWTLGAGIAAGLLLASAASAQPAMPAGNAANGKKLFETVGCYECHGYAGQGGRAGPKLIDPPAWEVVITQLRTPRQQMPPYTEKVLSNQQAADIYAHLKTFPKPADPATIPLLRN